MRAPRIIDDFRLTDHEGDPWTLQEQLSKGRPVALFTFRGTWCPFGVRTWRGLAALASDFTHADVPLLGISADEPWTLEGFRMRLDLPFRLLSDPQLVSARRLGVARGQRHPRARTYPAGAFLLPGFVVIGPDRRLLHAWLPDAAIAEELATPFAPAQRPVPREMLEAVRRVTRTRPSRRASANG